jgi:hypothetical protein
LGWTQLGPSKSAFATIRDRSPRTCASVLSLETVGEHGLRRADETRQPCYLETFAERNVPFYLRHGFELVVDETEPSSGIRTWGFYRAQAH